jgi:IS30 family transposase
MENTEQVILKNYYDVSTGFQSANALYKKLKPNYPEITLAKIKKVLSEQNPNQIHQKLKTKITDYNQIIAYGFASMCMDILDLSTFKSQNEGFRYLLLVQDIYSRFLFTAPMKDKTAQTVLLEIKKIEYAFRPSGIHMPFVSITADEGSEFKNNLCKNYFKNIPVFYKNPELHNSALSITDNTCKRIRKIFKKIFHC